jgi:predicted Zn-dependent protease
MRLLTPVSIVATALTVSAATLIAQTSITPPKNDYTPAEDVQLGRQAAAEVEKQVTLIRDDQVSSTVTNIGRRLANAIPRDLRHSEFRYSFQVVNAADINAFALPGGPMYVNRGMLEAAHTEGEAAGVMAHELSHVALRHGTAQATEATKYQLGGLLGAIVGSAIGGKVGTVISQGTSFGLNTAFLRYSRAYEQQADLLGAQIMAKAGYDPRDLAEMFRTIESNGGSGGPQWLSDHPNPGNRYDYITAEARTLSVKNPIRDTRAFDDTQRRLKAMPPAPKADAR